MPTIKKVEAEANMTFNYTRDLQFKGEGRSKQVRSEHIDACEAWHGAIWLGLEWADPISGD